jgi:hypothetical protein
MFFGGATSSAERDRLKKWTLAEIAAIPDQLTEDHFRNLIRAKYANPPKGLLDEF